MAPTNTSKIDCQTSWMNAAGRQPLLTTSEEVELGRLVREWQDHPDGPADAPAAIRRRGIKARNRFVTANLRLVHVVVCKYGGTAAIEDRLQTGTVGLIRAAEKFNPSNGYKFSTYAYLWIRQGLIGINEFAKYPVRIPGTVSAYFSGWKNGGHETSQVIKDAADLWQIPALALDSSHPDNDGDGTFQGIIADPNQPTFDDIAEQDGLDRALAAMAQFDSEQFALMELRNEGFNSKELAPLAGVGSACLLSRISKAKAVMRHLPEVVEVLGPAPAQVVRQPIRRRRNRVDDTEAAGIGSI